MSWFRRSYHPPYDVDPATVAAMAAGVDLPDLPRRALPPEPVELVVFLDEVPERPPFTRYDYSDGSTA